MNTTTIHDSSDLGTTSGTTASDLPSELHDHLVVKGDKRHIAPEPCLPFFL